MRYFRSLKVYIPVEAATLIGLTFVAATSYVYRSVMAKKKSSKSGVPKPASAVIDPRPETSPYGSPTCTIPFSSPLNVPLDILKRSPKLQAAYESRLPELPAIPGGVGHVLVHYLHTGTYESLKPTPTDTMSKQICELKTSIQAYAAARAYELPDLMRLAEAKIDKYGKGMPLPALLEVARDAYPTLTEGDAWFLDYLRARIRPHLKDAKSLMGSNLLDQISGILSPNRILLRTVLELFCERIAVALPEPVHPPAASAEPSTLASPITSPGTSRPVSPPPLPASPMSLLEMRSRSIPREEFAPPRKNPKATSWPLPDDMSEASWARSPSPDPVLPETAPPQFEAKPVREPAFAPTPFPELGPVILDVVPPPGPSIATRAVVVEPEARVAPEPEVELSAEPETKVEGKHEVKLQVEPETKVEAESEVKFPGEPEIELSAEPEIELSAESEIKLPAEPEVTLPAEPEITLPAEPEVKLPTEPEIQLPTEPEVTLPVEPEVTLPAEPAITLPAEPEVKLPVEPEVELPTESEVTLTAEPEILADAVEPEIKQEDEAISDPTPVAQRERKDSGKGIDLELLPNELESIPKLVPELETESSTQPQVRLRAVREADSGFWEGPDESGKERAPSFVELEPVAVPTSEPVHELESIAILKDIPGIDTRDFAGSDDADVKAETDDDKRAVSEPDVASKEADPVSLPAQDSVSEMTADILLKDALESNMEPESLPSSSAEEFADAATIVPEVTSVVDLPEDAQSKEVKALPETEKVEPFSKSIEEESLLTVQQAQEETVEHEAGAKPEPEPKAESSDAIQVPDDAQPAGTAETKAAQPSLEPGQEPAGKPEVQRATSDSAVDAAPSAVDAIEPSAVLSTQPAPEQEGAKTEADTADVQPCSAQVRQRSWKKRFLSLKYPVLFGRGM
ncbi:hypothetical protein C8A00DRAFT_15137 [Chaetomidium leptoderma]|uniref:Uncharacterized protein n=1 Tax=Chaetomidium leptoderma TaxID=669021 RepID=A0AAN6ZVM4_9PEZI|nr:hypothetical protein C8A00DRAFT_15137 [Chaetomidium leptoderma]